jgi:hypothetical protein
MLRTTGVAAVVLMVAGVGYAARPKPMTNVFETANRSSTDGLIDKTVFHKLQTMDIRPVMCSDAVFVRRVYLDVIGTLPTTKEARDFIDSKDGRNKRRLLIDRLLEREEYADYWSMKWGDILRIKAEFPANLWPNAAQAYHRWVRSSLATNKTYDKFVRELLTSSGSNFRVGQVNFYRAIQNRTPEGIAVAVALTAMGVRADAWPAERRAGMAAFFSEVGYKPTAEWKEEIVFWDPFHISKVPGNVVPGKAALLPAPKPPAGTAPATAATPPPPAVATVPGPLKAVFPDGTEVTIPPDRDPRDVFADWLIRPENPWFAKSIVNRLWAWLLGRGLIHEPDDIRDDNPPSYPTLLAYLEKEFIESGYDLKSTLRLILNTKTYQLSSVLRGKNVKADAYFARYMVRRLDAEVLADAINKVTGTTDLYTSAIPEPFTYIPTDKAAIAIADGSITSPFLALFDRSARATGYVNERSMKPLPSQWLHMLNSSHIQNKLESGTWMKTLVGSGNRPLEEIINELYLTILSRYPTQEEYASILEYLPRVSTTDGPPAGGSKYQGAGNRYARPAPRTLSDSQRRDNSIDIAWALLNSTEFLYRH